jgi:hypothetical protein
MLTSSSVQIGSFSVPLASGADLQPQSHHTTAILQLDLATAQQVRQYYRAWSLGRGFIVISETDTVTGWSLVVASGADVLVFTCFYEPRATLCIQVDVA